MVCYPRKQGPKGPQFSTEHFTGVSHESWMRQSPPNRPSQGQAIPRGHKPLQFGSDLGFEPLLSPKVFVREYKLFYGISGLGVWKQPGTSQPSPLYRQEPSDQQQWHWKWHTAQRRIDRLPPASRSCPLSPSYEDVLTVTVTDSTNLCGSKDSEYCWSHSFW